jgi:hypothetical protein
MKHLICALALCGLALPTLAEETSLEGRIAVELNAAEPMENACKLTFVITNGLGSDLTKAVYETVLFKTDGQVDRLTLFDFGALPQARPRVRQFEVPDLQCEALGRVLFNGAHACTGDGIAAGACESGILPSTLTSVEVLG